MIGENAALPDVYLDRSISDVSADAANTAVETAVTLTLPSWDAWRFGDVDFGGGDGAADYPVLRRAEDLWPGAQAVALADYQTRILLADGEPLGSELLLAGDTVLRLDVNGDASAGQAPAPICESDGAGGARAFTNYNNVTILFGVAAGGALSVKENCEFEIGLRRDALFVVDEILLTLTFMSGEESKTRVHTFFALAGAGADFWLRDSDRRRHRQRLRLDAAIGRWPGFAGRRGRLGGKAVADLQYLASASDRRLKRGGERDNGAQFPVVWRRRRRRADDALSRDDRNQRVGDARLGQKLNRLQSDRR